MAIIGCGPMEVVSHLRLGRVSEQPKTVRAIASYANGVKYQSPGSRAKRATLGTSISRSSTPKALHRSRLDHAFAKMMEPRLGYMNFFTSTPKVRQATLGFDVQRRWRNNQKCLLSIELDGELEMTTSKSRLKN